MIKCTGYIGLYIYNIIMNFKRKYMKKTDEKYSFSEPS